MDSVVSNVMKFGKYNSLANLARSRLHSHSTIYTAKFLIHYQI